MILIMIALCKCLVQFAITFVKMTLCDVCLQEFASCLGTALSFVQFPPTEARSLLVVDQAVTPRVPQQTNTDDCGIFMLAFLEARLIDIVPQFSVVRTTRVFPRA